MHSWELLLKAYRGQRPQSRGTLTAFQPHLPPHPTTVLYLESSRGEQGSVFKKSGRGREYSKGGEGEHPRAPPLHAPQHYTTSQSDTLMTTHQHTACAEELLPVLPSNPPLISRPPPPIQLLLQSTPAPPIQPPSSLPAPLLITSPPPPMQAPSSHLPHPSSHPPHPPSFQPPLTYTLHMLQD